jgi:hypothetical protein
MWPILKYQIPDFNQEGGNLNRENPEPKFWERV